MKTNLLSFLTLALVLTLGNQPSALAGESNGTGRGGGDSVVAVQALLPKVVSQSISLVYDKRAVVKPLIAKHRSGVAPHDDEYDAPEEVRIDETLALDPHKNEMGQFNFYRMTSLRAQYLLKGKWHDVRAEEIPSESHEIAYETFGLWTRGEGITLLKDLDRLPGNQPDLYPFFKLVGLFADDPEPNGYFDSAAHITPDLPSSLAGEFSMTVVVDGKPSSGEDLAERILEIGKTMVDQADLGDLNALMALDRQLAFASRAEEELSWIGMTVRKMPRVLIHLRDQIDRDNGQPKKQYDHFASVASTGLIMENKAPSVFEIALASQVAGEAGSLLRLGKSAVNLTTGNCDQKIYRELQIRLRNWTVGSAAYYADIKDRELAAYLAIAGHGAQEYFLKSGLIDVSSGAAMATIGIRQDLRRELNQSVAKYCERQSADRTKIDALINE